MTLMHTPSTRRRARRTRAAPYARAADPCQLEISGNDLMQYDKPELSAPRPVSRSRSRCTTSASSPREAMGHNWGAGERGRRDAVATAA